MTVGEKIRHIRNLRNLTQKELGIKSGFSRATADVRIRQYESNKMVPKSEKLNEIASALKVDPSALSDINITSIEDIMHILFELEESCGLEIDKDNDEYSLKFTNNFDNRNIQYALDTWYRAKLQFAAEQNDTEEIKAQKYYDYQNWKVRYPMDIVANEEHQLELVQSTFKNKLDKIENDTSIITFKDVMLIFEDMIKSNIDIEFHIKSIGVGQGSAICIFKNSQLLSLSKSQADSFARFLYTINELDRMGIRTTIYSHTYQGDTFSEYQIFSSQIETMMISLNDFKELFSNNTYDDITKNYKYKSALQWANVPIKNFV